MRILTILALVIIAGLANFAFWWFPNRPVPLDPPPAKWLASVSFAPSAGGPGVSRQGQDGTPEATLERLREDLRVIASRAVGIRTYSAREEMAMVPELAAGLGLKVTMGAWLSDDPIKNDEEVAALIAMANHYPDVISRVVVGNEVLLRRDLTPEQISTHIRRVRLAIKQPVSYADVWEWWLKYPQLADEVDFITIHLLPYWEDVPASVEKAAEHIVWTHRLIARRFPGKPILVGETGWPAAGRTRGAAVPGRVNTARFLNTFVRLAAAEGFDYNIIEAFDQGWKRDYEGTAGTQWGLFARDRTPKIALAGTVTNNPDWRWHGAIATALGLALFTLSLILGPASSLGGLAIAAALTMGVADAWVGLVVAPLDWDRLFPDVAQGLVTRALVTVAGLGILLAARRVLAGGGACGRERLLLAPTVRLLGIIAIGWSALIVFDGRYRDFPVPEYVIPALGLVALGWLAARARASATNATAVFAAAALFRPELASGGVGGGVRLERWVGRALIVGAALTVIAEGVLPLDAPLRGWWRGTTAAPISEVEWMSPNLEALAWAALQVLLALPFIAAARRR